MARLVFAAVALVLSAPAAAREPAGLHAALQQLERENKFSGAVVVRGAEGVRFARGYGLADARSGRAFTPDTPVDSASLAKPVTAAAVLMLANDRKLDLDAPVSSYIPEYPHAGATVRHLLSHSAGLTGPGGVSDIVGKSNEQLLAVVRERRLPPRFAPGSGFSYCNLCYVALASLVEKVSGQDYLAFVRGRLHLPIDVTIRPARLADWHRRAIGYSRTATGTIELADSYDDERFYGAANLSISAAQLALWGTEWWRPSLAGIRPAATTPAVISGKMSGLTWGNWYCAPGGRRCHYLGHHEGFHHMLYWDGDRRVSVAMVTNNGMRATLHQPLQRALVAFVENRPAAARREMQYRLPEREAPIGEFRLRTGERFAVRKTGDRVWVERRGLSYPAYPTGSSVRYVPGLDSYLAGDEVGRLHWIGLYESFVGQPLRLK